MKKNLLFLASAAFALTAATSCSNHDDIYDQNAINDAKLAEYNTKFIEEFGTPAADQDWGFGTTATKTRATQKPNGGATTFGPGNPDSGNYTVPSFTDAEKAEVIDYFKKTKNPTSVAFNYSEFLVYNIGGSHKKYTIKYYKTSENEHNILENENATPCKTEENIDGTSKMTELYYNVEHSADYNSGYGSPAILYDLDISNGLTFSYYNTLTSCRESKYVISEYNGNFYLAFDFTTISTTGANEYPDPKYDGDDYYDDWIILLVPGKSVTTTTTRVFAEDLGLIGDWDFNDVVFDVTSDGEVILQAAGGTLPLYLTINGQSYEVHEKFNVAASTPVNVGTGTTHDPVEIATGFEGDASDITIEVEENGTKRTIYAYTGKPAGKFAVSEAIDWQSEGKHIKELYPGFKDWVGDASKANTWYTDKNGSGLNSK